MKKKDMAEICSLWRKQEMRPQIFVENVHRKKSSGKPGRSGEGKVHVRTGHEGPEGE